MYSWEIDDIVARYNNNLPASVYIKICKTSPQIIHVKRMYDNVIKIVAKDVNGDNVEYKEWYVNVFPDKKYD